MKPDDPFTKLLKSSGMLRQIPPTLSEFISSHAADGFELTPQLVWEAAAKLYGKVAGEAVCPPSICKFIAELVRASQVEHVLDPFVGYGTLLGTVVDVVRPRSLTAVSPNPSVLDAARALLSRTEGATFRIGDMFGEQLESVGPVDLVISAPPFGLPARTFSLDGTEVHDDGGHEILLRACLHLRNPGVGVFVVSPRILAGRLRGVLGVLHRFDLYLDAYFHVPSGAFAPFTMIETAIIVVRSGRRPETLFVGELVDDDAAQRTLLGNHAERMRGGTPKLGALVPLDEFRSVARLEFNERIEGISRELDLPAITLGELAESIERCPNALDELAFRPNTLFVPLGVTADATADAGELRTRLRDVVQIALRPDVADARIVAGFLNTTIGRELRSSRATGTTTKRLQISDLAELPLWLPDLGTQREVVRVDQELSLETERLRELKVALWARMNPVGLAAVVPATTQEDRYLDWLDSLPFPLASILWSHHALSTEPTRRYERLLFFFEALTQFLATFVLSGARGDPAFFANEWKAIRERLTTQNVPLERATFGTWVIVFETLAKSIRRDVSGDEDARAHWCGLLAIDDWTLVDALISSKMVTLLKEANQLRNVTRHSGALTERDAELRESLLTSALLRFRQLVGTRWNSAPLVLPRHSRYARGSYHTRVHLVMGTRSPFQQREFALRHPLEDGDLHIVSPRSGSTCRLLPFVQMGPSPQSEPTACYFFSRRQGELMRFVSYHYDAQPELEEAYPAVRDALDELDDESVDRNRS